MTTFTDADKLNECERELAMRKRYYPKMIAVGSLSEVAARRQTMILQAIAEDYRVKVQRGVALSPESS